MSEDYTPFQFSQLLSLVGGSIPVANMLLQKFIQLAPSGCSKLQVHWDARDYTELRREAHSLKGSSSYIFATQLSTLCLNLQHAAEEHNDAVIPALISQVEAEFLLVDEAIKKHLQLQ